MPFTFEKLHVYQKAVDFTDTICGLTERFPRGYGFLVDRLNRASLSIAANIAEGNGRFTKADRKKLLRHRPRLGAGVPATTGAGSASRPVFRRAPETS